MYFSSICWMVTMKIRKEKKTEDLSVLYCEEEKNLAPGACYGPVVRDIYIIECCEAGFGSVIINGKEFPITPRSCYVLLPGDSVIHKASEEDPRRGFWCAVDGVALGRYFSKSGISSDQPFAPSELYEKLAGQLRRMTELWRSDSAGTPLLLTACVYEFLGTILSATASGPAEEAWLGKALGLMETRYHEPLSVSEIAGEVGLERGYFSTIFKEKTGLGPHHYLTKLRVQKAAALLNDPAHSVAEVAVAVGLDAGNFSRVFKKEMGQSPLQYRK